MASLVEVEGFLKHVWICLFLFALEPNTWLQYSHFNSSCFTGCLWISLIQSSLDINTLKGPTDAT